MPKSTIIDDKYTVHFHLAKSEFSESYRVKNSTGKTFFLKLFNFAKLQRTQFDPSGKVKEIELLKNCRHPNLVTYAGSGDWIYNNERFSYLALDFISGETLSNLLKREKELDLFKVKSIALGVLNGLKYLHNQNPPILHNHLNHQNVMMDLGGKMEIPKIVDFSYARLFTTSIKVFSKKELNPFYLAPECFNDVFSPKSDLYAVGTLMYHLLYCLPPWFADISDYKKDELVTTILEQRKKPLKFQKLNTVDFSEVDLIISVIKKSIDQNPENRFNSADEMIRALNGEIQIEVKPASIKVNKDYKIEKGESHGFGAIAGMDVLKEILYNDVIRALDEQELYKSYGLTIPNGLLLYGPPGCGKSFFAEKLAEEADYNYIEVKPSSLASIYVHGAQEKIGELFNQARKEAPTIINFEEFDAFVPKREGNTSPHQSGEVNEFLAQLNNCGKDGVFVIASTNQPNLIDPAVLRAGRIDKVIFIPPPDHRARKAMFKKLLKDRPIDFGIDYDELSDKTENYVSVDLKFLTDEAARSALKQKSKITQKILIEVIKSTRPSVSLTEIQKYTEIKSSLEGDSSKGFRPKIGFKIRNS
ncbi:AAA family ATPase [Fulvivirga aurantia]|uniref:AAA family ATPase n=1 Tax=Fulvivirga aurantia TaxID=2529383 RepID=UPI001CA41665|nr:AAA family ATPase [Fulvivirga aurantia]